MPQQAENRTNDRRTGKNERHDIERLASTLNGKDDPQGTRSPSNSPKRSKDYPLSIEPIATRKAELFTPGQPPDDDTRKKMADLRKTSGDKLLALLSAEQKTKWTTLQGEPFKGEIRVGPPR